MEASKLTLFVFKCLMILQESLGTLEASLHWLLPSGMGFTCSLAVHQALWVLATVYEFQDGFQ